MVQFIITAIEAFVLLILAVLVYRTRKNNFLNRSFALVLAFLAAWLLCGFPHLLVSNPSVRFVTFEFRFANSFAILTISTFFLFGLAFLKGKKPGQAVLLSIYAISIVLALSCLSDLSVKAVSYENGRFFVINGSLMPFYNFSILVFAVGSGICITLKRHNSKSTDRARATYILLGFVIFFLSSIPLTMILPAIMESDVTSNYAFFLAFIPAGFTAYAILRHRLLDVRLAVRRSFAYILTLLIFGMPLVAAYAIFRYTWKTNTTLEMSISVLVLALSVGLSPAALRWSNKIASKLFFAGMYDEVELLHDVSSIFTSTANIRDGLISATSLICDKLGLEQLKVAIPDEVTRGQGNWVIGSVWSENGPEGFQDIESSGSSIYLLWNTLLVADDSRIGTENTDGGRALREMDERGLSACLPVKGPAGKMGVLMVGKKVNRSALDPLDIDFLKQFTDRAGIFIENYLLSTYLLSQLEELSETKRKLEESDHFKTDIINITSHEFRTPLTILNGYAYMLRDHYQYFSEQERLQYVEYITTSCDRLSAILDQFLTVSYFQKGTVSITPKPTPIEDLFMEVKSGFVPEQSQRIESEVLPVNAKVLTDRSYLVILLRNLVENAIRFSPQSLPVILKAEEKDDEVFITIKDFGEGINPNEVENIFQPFTRLEDANHHRIGTGLGLYIVRLIADLLGTTVDVESMPEAGTTFYFKLPHA
jgi:signal transduction histidine kinase